MDHLFTPEDYIAIACQVKSELRRRMRGLRAALSSETRGEKSVLVVESLARHEVFAGVRTVGLYAPMVHRCELDIDPLFAILRQRGIDVAYPRVLEDGGLAFYRVESLSVLEERGNGFREPADDEGTRIEALDAIVVPAVGADLQGNRLGYGGGAYDRALASFAERPRTIAVLYDFQVLVEVPQLATDVPVDWVLTDRRVFHCGTPQI